MWYRCPPPLKLHTAVQKHRQHTVRTEHTAGPDTGVVTQHLCGWNALQRSGRGCSGCDMQMHSLAAAAVPCGVALTRPCRGESSIVLRGGGRDFFNGNHLLTLCDMPVWLECAPTLRERLPWLRHADALARLREPLIYALIETLSVGSRRRALSLTLMCGASKRVARCDPPPPANGDPEILPPPRRG